MQVLQLLAAEHFPGQLLAARLLALAGREAPEAAITGATRQHSAERLATLAASGPLAAIKPAIRSTEISVTLPMPGIRSAVLQAAASDAWVRINQSMALPCQKLGSQGHSVTHCHCNAQT